MLNAITPATSVAGSGVGIPRESDLGLPAKSMAYLESSVSQIDALPPKAEVFAQMFVAEGDASRAYRTCYECAPDIKPQTIRKRAHELRHSAPVATRIRALQAAAAESFVVSIGERMQHLHAIATCDASEVVRVVVESCRCCRGDGGRPQWHSEAEFRNAVEQHMASLQGTKPLPLPLFGGFDFDPTLAPVDGCASCHGHGISRVVLTDSNEWSPAARAAFKGATQKADGSIVIEMENRLTASDQLARLAGFYVDRSESVNRNYNLSVSADLASDPDALLAAYNAGRTL